MRLSKIKLAGFKSFVDPTTIHLATNLTGVVGPNGCGKSNTIDAVRWVMGESSAKNLRGDSMADVIFNGSNTRKPVGQATIELVFDNSDGTLGGEYANYSEISIRRLVTRDGQSNYFLNGTRCRRRDITDIFLGTGLGPRSYAIIEQGTISRLIEAKPEELRTFLEEAAGISKYKERRRETETRMRHTRDNLDRLNDLRDELDKQLSHLQRQAKSAERFKELKQEERLLKGQLQALRWQLLDGDVQRREGTLAEKETALEALIARQRSSEAEIERNRDAHVEATEKFNRVQSEFYRVGADIARLEQTIQHGRERTQQQQQDLEQVERSWNEAQSHQEGDRLKIEALQESLMTLEPQRDERVANAELSAARLAESEETMQGWQARWETFNSQAAAPSQTAQVERTRIQQFEQQALQLEQRRTRLNDERANLSVERLDEEVALLREQIAEDEIHQAAEEERLQGALYQIGEQREQNQHHSSELDQLRTHLQRQRGRHASLEALQQAALGKRKGAVNDWLHGQGLNDAPRLAQGIVVEQGWEHAVECVLGSHLEAVCVEGIDPIVATLGGLQHGAVTLFDTRSEANSRVNDEMKSLLEKISSVLPLGSLLDGVYIADDLDQALALRARLSGSDSVVTRDGIWLGRGWLRVARDSDDHAGVLHREQELKELAEEIEQLEEKVAQLQQLNEEGRSRLASLEQEREALQSQLNEVNRRLGERRSQLSGKQARQEQVLTRRERIDGEIEELQRHIAETEQAVSSARSTLHLALGSMEELAQQRELLEAERDELRAALEQVRNSSRGERDQLHELSVELQRVRTELETTRQGLERMDSQLQQLGERREELKMLLSQGDGPLQEHALDLEALLERRMVAETALAEARKVVGEIEHTMRELEGGRGQAERETQTLRSELEGLRMAWQELNVRRKTLQEQAVESGYELEALLEALTEGADVQGWEQQVDAAAQRIARLGPINLAAIEEYGQQSERKSYLDAQNADLSEALDTLENAIRKIDRETRTRFKETFDLVNKGLQEKFPRLFGGGHAYLELTGDDLLDTGVTVMARPPGKRNSTIHLLSGGEKALTAVAMVFSIFELNPSPFCMLDEVDAPLDEANVTRFCNLVREMSERVQFIFITHNKTTMEMANQLAGVTMHEPGVSRLVTVDVDEAIELAAI